MFWISLVIVPPMLRMILAKTDSASGSVSHTPCRCYTRYHYLAPEPPAD